MVWKACKTCFALLFGTLLCVSYRAFGAFIWHAGTILFLLPKLFFRSRGEVECGKIKSNSLVLHYIQREILIIRPQEEKKPKATKPNKCYEGNRQISILNNWTEKQREKTLNIRTDMATKCLFFENCLGINWIKPNPLDTFGRKYKENISFADGFSVRFSFRG